ncbi:MAG: alpha-ketoglutarate-dependent dioxygenase AlkB [Actinomycetota bacterium]|nr:alpha-ketoglutarate-dependent dioxygenase AlkB [Actinomycetota bacterium]
MRPAAPAAEAPDGLVYRPDFLTAGEEAELLAVVEEIDFVEVRMRGRAARRTVRHFGYHYGYDSWELTPADPVPDSLAWLAERAGALGGVPGEELAEVLVSRYPPGAGIGWHRDAPMFGPVVVGVSLGASCTMRFRRQAGGVHRTFAMELAPRSAYVLSGAARWSWQHAIPPVSEQRYSITFRTVREHAKQ